MPKNKNTGKSTQAASTLATEVTDAIFVTDYDGDTASSKANLRTEASQIAKKINGKAGRKAAVCDGIDEFGALMNATANKTVTKIHLISHGNQEVVGNYNSDALAEAVAPLIQNKNSLSQITLHCCNSGSVHPTNFTILAQQFVSALSKYLTKTQITKLVVRGSDGKSFTDSDGRNWVLKEGVDQPNYKDNKSSEAAFVASNTQDRKGAARPKFMISRKTTDAAFGDGRQI